MEAITQYLHETEKSPVRHSTTASSAQAAAMAVRKMFIGASDVHTTVEVSQHDDLDNVDPLSGWSDGVALEKGHFCLLLKPQIVLRSEAEAGAVLILAAVQGKLQTYGIMDMANMDDPVSGKVMTR